MTTEYATSYDHTTTVTQYSTTQTTSSGAIDKEYIRSIPGILKIVEVVLDFIAFVIVVATLTVCHLAGAKEFFNFAVMLALVSTVVLYFFLLFKLQFRLCRCSCIFWPFVEMCYYISVVVLLLVANVVFTTAACTDAYRAGVAFGWFAMVVYVVDLIFAIKTYRKSRVSRSQTTMHQETTTTTRY